MEHRLPTKCRLDRRRPAVCPVVFWIAAAAAVLSSMATSRGADDRVKLVFCCDAENDLYRVMTGDGMSFQRHDSAPAAIDAAREGAGVLILADAYPQNTTRIDPAAFDLAALRFSPPVLQGHSLPAAGLPWFMTMFGRDSIFTSLQALPFTSELAASTLLALGVWQGTRVDDFRERKESEY